DWALKGPVAFSVAIDPKEPEHVIATTVGQGVFRSEDGGRTFEQGGDGVFSPVVFSSVISPTERTNDGGVVYVGTMPSMMFRSEDGGRTFRHLAEFDKLECLKEAAFPPVPASHMIHMIAASFHTEGTVLAGIELGGVVKSTDSGETWELTDGGPDCHQLLFHPQAEGRVYESDGNGYFESHDDGETWQRPWDGFPADLTYFYDMAVDPGDPGLQMISVGRNQYQAHGINPYFYKKGVHQGAFSRTSLLSNTFSSLYRRRDGQPWEEMLEGLPDPNGSAQGRFATALNDDKGTIYYSTIPGDVYRTTDGGDSWEFIEIKWPADAAERTVHVARAVKE
ncbi:MAG TPA: sialidase family protein, partial [Baekduia sp.]|nr:sialidase family protein [Baekduia sp.]